MKLTQMDREMLPAWVYSSENSFRCFQWLCKKADTMLKLNGQILCTVKMGYFLFCIAGGKVIWKNVRELKLTGAWPES